MPSDNFYRISQNVIIIGAQIYIHR